MAAYFVHLRREACIHEHYLVLRARGAEHAINRALGHLEWRTIDSMYSIDDSWEPRAIQVKPDDQGGFSLINVTWTVLP